MDFGRVTVSAARWIDVGARHPRTRPKTFLRVCVAVVSWGVRTTQGSTPMDSATTNQHSVPQFLLRRFASTANGKQIFVFDKATERSLSDAIRRVASERGFYDCEVQGQPHSIDPLLTKMESAASNFINKIIEARSLSVLSDTGRKMIALFAAVQMLRTDAQRKQLKGMIDNVYSAIVKIGGDPNKVQGFEFLDEEQTRTHSILSLREIAADLMPHFLDKCWVLYSTAKDNPFYISDNPIAMFNSNQDPLRGTLGLRVPGIEVHMPLSSTLSLGFLCPTLEREIRGSYDLASALGHSVPLHIHQLVDAFGGSKPFPLDDENIKHLNSLQVFFAERFVYTSRDKFDLIREMLRSTPKLKSGPRSG